MMYINKRIRLYHKRRQKSNTMWGWRNLIFSFLCNVLYIIVCIFIPFILAIALSVLLRLTASDYPSSFYHEQSNTTEFSIMAFTTSFSPCILISFCCKLRLSQANSIPRTMHYIIFHLSPFLVNNIHGKETGYL
jgi:ABC-type Fe3+ transport system permease subunit